MQRTEYAEHCTANYDEDCDHMSPRPGRIPEDIKPEDLPVLQSSKFGLIVNHQTVRMLGRACRLVVSKPDEVSELPDMN
jgi:hypothetical protein